MQNQENGIHLAGTRSLAVASLASAWLGCQSLCFSLAGAVLAIATLSVGQQQAIAALLTNWQFDPTTNQLEFTLPPGVTPQYSILRQPTRILVEIPDTQVGIDTTQLYPTGTVRSVRLSQFRPSVARILVDFAPDVVLTPEQVQLQQVGSENRWVLRPLVSRTIQPVAPTTVPQQVAADAAPQQAAPAAVPQQNASTPPSPPPSPPQPQASPATTEAQQPSNPATSDSPPASAPLAASSPVPTPSLPIENQPIRPISVEVRIPVTQTRLTTNPRPQAPVPPSLPPVTPTSRSVPVSRSVPAIAAQPTQILPYGQPLPPQQVPAIPANSFDPTVGRSLNVLLPAGSTLSLFYPGPQPLPLNPKPDRQEVLVLLEGIRDLNGNLVIPPNTPILGRFETNNEGSRFVAQAIYLKEQTIPLVAQSDRISGGQPKPSTRSIIRNSSIGGIAAFLLSGLSGFGLLAGAAAGLGATYATAPQPATILPGQVLSVQLTEDLLLPTQ